MIEKIIIPKKITKQNFSSYGDIISTEDTTPIDINAGYAKRYDDLANINTSKDNGVSIVSITNIPNEDRYDGKTSFRKSSFYTNERNCFFSICSTLWR